MFDKSTLRETTDQEIKKWGPRPMTTKSTQLLEFGNTRGRFRFRISTLLLLTLTVGVGAGWWSDRKQLYSRQLDLQNKIRQQAAQIIRQEERLARLVPTAEATRVVDH